MEFGRHSDIKKEERHKENLRVQNVIHWLKLTQFQETERDSLWDAGTWLVSWPAQREASSGLHSQPHSSCSSRTSSLTLSTGSLPVSTDLITILTFLSRTLVARHVSGLLGSVQRPLHLEKRNMYLKTTRNVFILRKILSFLFVMFRKYANKIPPLAKLESRKQIWGGVLNILFDCLLTTIKFC